MSSYKDKILELDQHMKKQKEEIILLKKRVLSLEKLLENNKSYSGGYLKTNIQPNISKGIIDINSVINQNRGIFHD